MRYLSILTAVLLSGPAMAELTCETTLASGEKSSRVTRLPALHVAAGSPPAPGLAPGPATTTWTGKLIIEQRARVYFSFEGQGTASLKVDGEEVLSLTGDLAAEKSARLRLNPGEIPISITYQSPADGSASFRLFWEDRQFTREPIPPKAFAALPAAEKPTADPAHLIASHNCLQCHQAGEKLSTSPHALPELTSLKAPAPDLTNIGDRRQEAWLVRWIAQPDKLKPSTTMPAMVDHTKAAGAQQAADIAAYLAGLTSKPAPPAVEIDDKLAQAGGAHFHNLGCVACHTLPSVSEIDYEHHRIPLNNVAEKFQPGTLSAFLKKPDTHWKAIKMPDFQLSDEEAGALAAYLTKEATGRHTPDPSEFPPGDARRGEELVKSLNCASCHSELPAGSSPAAPSFEELGKLASWTDQGCLGPDEKRGSAPRLILNKEEKAALATHHAQLPALLLHDTPAAYANRQVEALRCVACHNHDEQSAFLNLLHPESNALVGHVTGHEEKVEQFRPILTYMGAKLTTPYFARMLKGEARPRPWLDMRMPAFHRHAAHLPAGLAAQHGLAPAEADTTPVDAELAKHGQELIALTGYACVTCHGVGEAKPLAAFEVEGINFAHTHSRLRAAYYHQWMNDPSRVVADTKMPKYTQPDGSAIRSDFLEGDAQKQFQAIWEYFKTLEEPKAPAAE
ncbi:MAG: c-type cytochrome [Verrucomicrobiales bacterium]